MKVFERVDYGGYGKTRRRTVAGQLCIFWQLKYIAVKNLPEKRMETLFGNGIIRASIVIGLNVHLKNFLVTDRAGFIIHDHDLAH